MLIRYQSPRRRTRSTYRKCAIQFVVVCLAVTFSSGILAQTSSLHPKLAPGQQISGKDHPEYFSRRAAFEMMLELLSIKPENATQRQMRARGIESRIGLGTEDTAQLEQIVEAYRIQEAGIRSKISQLRLSGTAVHSNFLVQSANHLQLLRETNLLINERLSKAGSSIVNAFLDEIISKSTIQSAVLNTQNARNQ